MTAAGDWHVRWPAARFYFEVLDTRALAKRRPTERELGFLLENSLPVPLEHVHAVFCDLRGGRYLACAVDRAVLLGELPSGALALTPETLPEFLGQVDAEAADLNLLHGEFEPAAIRASRRRRAFVGMVALAAIVALLAFGMERRVRAAGVAAAEVTAKEAQVLQSVLGPAPATVPAVQRRMALLAERRKLERTRLQGPHAELPDASEPLARVLAAWPKDPEAQVDHLGVTAQGVTIRGNAPDPAVAQDLADRLQQVDGFTVEQPQFAMARGRVLFTIRLRREGERP